MSAAPAAAQSSSLALLLDDFLDAIDYLPSDLSLALAAVSAKEQQVSELHRALIKKQSVYLRAEEKGLEPTLRGQLLKKIEKDRTKLLALIEDKMGAEEEVKENVTKLLSRLDDRVRRTGVINAVGPLELKHVGILDDFPLPGPSTAGKSSNADGQGQAPDTTHQQKKVYCYCRGDAKGAMVACDGQSCPYGAWFHLSCAGLAAAPASRKWYCRSCQQQAQAQGSSASSTPKAQ